METNARVQRAQDDRAKSFAEWLTQSETRLLMSLIPQGDNPDALQVLLQTAFNRGYHSGEGFVMIELLTKMMSDKPK